ncbi:hypothetical protein J2Z44_002137 [Clostridium punense]|uniref:Uncharacterized protein n=1 Tax=Clostridium punense TaxID=1054297 RepID=A0ABS4K3F7_9CLOT|nr:MULTISPECIES: hypothetical protein [Clostridium]EQB87822.1 hypothetical protein M918_07185 [Clostridium sp. BL8]MBP2022316.1 hypothetical protein [Clostridium punense]
MDSKNNKDYVKFNETKSDPQFPLEISSKMNWGKDKNPLNTSKSNTDVEEEIDLSYKNGSGLET